MEKVFEPVTKSIKDPSKNVRKVMMVSPEEIIQTIADLNENVLDILNDRGIMASYLVSALSKISNPEQIS